VDSPKTGVHVTLDPALSNVRKPHFMRPKNNSVHSTRILGILFDRAKETLDQLEKTDISVALDPKLLIGSYEERQAYHEPLRNMWTGWKGEVSAVLKSIHTEKKGKEPCLVVNEKYHKKFWDEDERTKQLRASALYELVYMQAIEPAENEDEESHKFIFPWLVCADVLCTIKVQDGLRDPIVIEESLFERLFVKNVNKLVKFCKQLS